MIKIMKTKKVKKIIPWKIVDDLRDLYDNKNIDRLAADFNNAFLALHDDLITVENYLLVTNYLKEKEIK